MQDIEDLLDVVLTATTSGALRWEEENRSSFFARLPKHRLDVWSGTDDDDGTRWVSVQLREPGPDGQVLDATTADQFSPRYDRLMRMFQIARRSALEVDAVISSIKQDLELLTKVKAS